ncbi:MAG: response regulator transcription factor [Coriobacteriales bacterium]|jgi:two-component system response regulator NreC
MIRVVLADDHSMVRMGFKMILEQQPDITVVGEAADPDEAMRAVEELSPDVLVTDISMGTEKSGLLLAERLSDSTSSTAVVVLTMHEEQAYLRQALERGALGYVLKSSSDEALVNCVRAASRGETYICEQMLGGFVHDSLAGTNPAAEELTPRETELVSLAVRGYSNAQIADRLCLSVKTVENQKAKVMTKLGLGSKPELFEYALSHGLI